MESDVLDISPIETRVETGNKEELSKEFKRKLEWILICLLLLGYVVVSFAQTNLNEINYGVISRFKPSIKDAFKFGDLPEIKDSVKRLKDIKYGIVSQPLFPKYQVQPIAPAKIQNEPLTKLYRSLLKVGYGPIYNTPYGEFWISNTRNRDKSYGAHLKHLSSTNHLQNVGYGGYSDNVASVFGKQFYKKHTLSGEFNYERNVIHYYGYDTSINKISDKNYTKQRYQLFEPKLQLVSHYTDSSHINHEIGLKYYNLQNLNREEENNFNLNTNLNGFVQKEKVGVNFSTDYYNHKQSRDTLNDLIVTLSPYVEANGKRYKTNLTINTTLEKFKQGVTGFYNFEGKASYDVYENIIIPYVEGGGGTGKIIKNSFRSLSKENPFVDSSLNYTNTLLKYYGVLGVKGNLSNNTSYDAKASYAQYDSMHFFVIDYSKTIQMNNRFKVIYDNTSLLTISGQIKHQPNAKLNLIAKGNYYIYKTKNEIRAYQKPDFDFTFSGIYNLQSKIIFRMDIFVMGNQWALSQVTDAGITSIKPAQIHGYGDANIEVEYRYSKMLSFFVRANNIANQRYYRWDRYPSQRLGLMLGLTFVPF